MNSFNNNDPFKQFVKSKLADYKHQAPPNGWNELEQSLFAVQKTKVIHTKWIASSVAAVAAALIGVFFLFQDTSKELSIQTAENKVEQQITPSSKETSKEKREQPLTTKEKSIVFEESTSSLIADNTSAKKQTTSVVTKTTKKDDQAPLSVSDNSFPAKEDVATPKSDEQAKQKSKTSDIDEEKKQQMIQDFINEGRKSPFITDEIKTKKNRSKHAISLSGSSALSSSQQANITPTTLRSSLNDSYGSYTMAKMEAYNNDAHVNPESEINHKQPISFGILTSFDITPKLQIETGLVYSYLSSESTNKSDDFINTEKMQFHYLGVPLNVNYTLLSIHKLKLFATAGAMIEKDVNGKISYNDKKTITSVINSDYINETSSKIEQSKPQISVAGGIGLTYPLYNKTSLFGKIGGRYYINANNEYRTYYSDEKFGLDIQLGVKLNF